MLLQVTLLVLIGRKVLRRKQNTEHFVSAFICRLVFIHSFSVHSRVLRKGGNGESTKTNDEFTRI